MICRVEALRYRCLKYIKKELGNFHILVGPNASGKSTFLDVISFLGDIVREGLETAVIISAAHIENILCFAKSTEGATDVINGNDHPDLKEWKGETPLDVLFASGVLG